jgi:helix-turn-helix protein
MLRWRRSRSRKSRRETSRPGTPARSRSSPPARAGVSERFACRVTGQHRATQRHQPPSTTAEDPDAALRAWLCNYAKDHPRRGFRPAHHDARADGWIVNHKKIQRLWREEGLRVTAASTPQTPRHLHRTADGRRGCAQPGVGGGPPVRCHHRRAAGPDRLDHRQTHPRMPGWNGRTQHHRRGPDRRA